MNVSIGSLDNLSNKLKTEQEYLNLLKELDGYKHTILNFDNNSSIRIDFTDRPNVSSYKLNKVSDLLSKVKLSEEKKEEIKLVILKAFKEQIDEDLSKAKKDLANEVIGGID